jgi:outer membrane biosynthesis protein TonB
VADLQETDESKGKQKKMFIAVGAAALLLAAGTVGYLKLSSKTVTPNQPVAQQTATTATTSSSSTTLKPTASAAAPNTSPAVTVPADTPQPEPGLGKQSEMMKSQLSAPSRISNDLKALGSNQAAPTPGFSAAGMDGMGSSPAVFTPGGGPKVKVAAPKTVSISAGIAVGLLVQKTPPVYPPIARSAHVSGTVVIQATIPRLDRFRIRVWSAVRPCCGSPLWMP